MKIIHCFYAIILLSLSMASHAQSLATKRILQLQNNQVTVWKTIIYPSTQHMLPMHRHEYNRVIVALTDGTLKIKTDKGIVHYLRLKKDSAYYLKKDVPNERHSDQNISGFPIKVMVIELK